MTLLPIAAPATPLPDTAAGEDLSDSGDFAALLALVAGAIPATPPLPADAMPQPQNASEPAPIAPSPPSSAAAPVFALPIDTVAPPAPGPIPVGPQKAEPPSGPALPTLPSLPPTARAPEHAVPFEGTLPAVEHPAVDPPVAERPGPERPLHDPPADPSPAPTARDEKQEIPVGPVAALVTPPSGATPKPIRVPVPARAVEASPALSLATVPSDRVLPDPDAAAVPASRPADQREPKTGAEPASAPAPLGVGPSPLRTEAPLPVDAPAATPVVPPAVPEQIVSAVVPLHGRGDGRHEVTLELRPEDLGAIRVEVSVEHQTVHLTLHAAEPATGRLLAAVLPDLRSALADAGLHAGHVAVNPDGGADANTRRHTPVVRPDGTSLTAKAEPAPHGPRRRPVSADGRLDLFL